MAVNQTEQTTNDVQQEQETVKDLNNDLITELSSDFSKSLDLPTEKEEVAEEEPEPIGDPEEEEDEDQEDGADVTQGEKEEESEDDDLIPRSKVEKRFSKMTAQQKALEAKIAALEVEATKNQDPEVAKLEKLSTSELETLLDQIEEAKYEAMASQDKDRYSQLIKLGKNAGKTLRTAPERFQKAQQRLYQEAALGIQSDPDIDNVDDAAPKITEIATRIYGQSKALQSKESGQAEALVLAAEHYKEISKISTGKSKNVNSKLKRENNKLKKKTSLDGKVMSGDMKKQVTKKMKEKAHGSTADFNDKYEFAKTSGLLGDISRFGNKGR